MITSFISTGGLKRNNISKYYLLKLTTSDNSSFNSKKFAGILRDLVSFIKYEIYFKIHISWYDNTLCVIPILIDWITKVAKWYRSIININT